MANRSNTFSAELRELKEQMEALGSEIAPALGNVAHQAASPLHKLAGYTEIATKFAPQIREFVSRFTNRGEDAVVAAVRAPASRRHWIGRHRVLATGLVISVSFITYGIASGNAMKLLRKIRPTA